MNSKEPGLYSQRHFISGLLGCWPAAAGWLILTAGEVGLLPAHRLLALRSPGVDDRGVFVLSLAGRQIGTEEFEITSSEDKIEARAKIQFHLDDHGKSVELTTFPDLVMNQQLEPITYTWSQKGPQASELAIDFRSSPAQCRYRTVTGGEDRREFALPKAVVVLDATNVIHHYQLLVDRYRATSGGQQTFQAFVPQEAWPTVLTVEDRGSETLDRQGRSERLRHLVVKTERAPIDLWIDDSGRLIRVSNPESQFEALRKE